MAIEGVEELYRVDRIEDLLIGGIFYRIEVHRCTQKTSMQPLSVEFRPFSVRAYRRMEIDVQPHGSPGSAPVLATVWVHLPLSVRDHAQEDFALDEARAALLEEVNRRRSLP